MVARPQNKVFLELEIIAKNGLALWQD